MDKIGSKIASFLPARSDDKVRSMASRCLEEMKACPSDDTRMETAEKCLDWIARRGKDGDLKEIASAALTIPDGTAESVRMAGYMAAISGIAASGEKGDTDSLLISISTDALDRTNNYYEAAKAAKPFIRMLAEKSGNAQIKSLAEAVAPAEDNIWGPSQAQCFRTALSVMASPLSLPLEQVLISVGTKAIDELKKSRDYNDGVGGQVAGAFLREVGKVTSDGRMKSLAHVVENLSPREDGAQNAALEAFSALNGTAGMTAQEALMDTAAKAVNNASTDEKKGGAPWPFIREIGLASADPGVKALAQAMPAQRSEIGCSHQSAVIMGAAVLGALAHPQAGPVELVLTSLAGDVMNKVGDDSGYSIFSNHEPDRVAKAFMKGLSKVSDRDGVKKVAEAALNLDSNYGSTAHKAGYEAALDTISGNLDGSADVMLTDAAARALGTEGDSQKKSDAARPFLEQLAKTSADGNVKAVCQAASHVKSGYNHYGVALCYSAAVDALRKGLKGAPEDVLLEVAIDALKDRPEIQDGLSGSAKVDAAKPYLAEIGRLTADPLRKSLAAIACSDGISAFREAHLREITGTMMNPPAVPLEAALATTAQSCLKNSLNSISEYTGVGKAFLSEIAETTKQEEVKVLAETAIHSQRGLFSLYGDFSAASCHKATFDEIIRIMNGASEPIEARLASLSLQAMKEWDQVQTAPDSIARGKGEIAQPYLAKIGELTKDAKLKSIADAAGLFEKCQLHAGKTFCSQRALEIISQYKGESPDAVMLSILRDLLADGNLNGVEKGDAVPPLLKALARTATDPAIKAVSSAMSEYNDYVSSDSRTASLISACDKILNPGKDTEIPVVLARTGLDAMRRKSMYPAEAGIPFLAAIGRETKDEELKKLIGQYARGGSSLRSDESEKAVKRIFESIIEISDTAQRLADVGSGEKGSSVVVEDDFVDIDGIKLKRHDKEPSAKSLMSVAGTWYRDNSK
jgi:hypothetical protein